MTKILKVENYINEENDQLTVLTPINGEPPIYITQMIISNGQMQIPMPVKIEGVTTIEEAFTKMPESIAEVKKMIDEESKKPKLVTPQDLRQNSGQINNPNNPSNPNKLQLVRG